MNREDITKTLSPENFKAIEKALDDIAEAMNIIIADGIDKYPELKTVDTIGSLYAFCSNLTEEGSNWLTHYRDLMDLDEELEELVDQFYDEL